MSENELIIVVLGVLALAGLGVIAYIARQLKGGLAEIAAMFQPVLERLVEQADAALAPYGPQLKPAHELVTALGPLVDDPDDFIVKALATALGAKPEDVVAALQPVVEGAADLTNGKVETPSEAVPLAEQPPEQETLPENDGA